MPSKEALAAVFENEEGELVVTLDLPAAAAHPGDEDVPEFAGRPAGLREYVIADVSTRTGRWVTRITENAQIARKRMDAGEDADAVAADLRLSDERESLLYERLLGKTYDDMETDEVPNRLSKFAGVIAYAWVVAGLEGAQRCWEAGPDGDPKPVNREERRAKKATAKSRASGSRSSASGASANTTPRQASTRSTRTRN